VKRRKFDVKFSAPHCWYVQERGCAKRESQFTDKEAAVARGRVVAKRAQPSQLFIRRKDGRIAAKGEHTYPRSSDPRRTKG
jgi:hypothetical protein